MDYTKIGFYLSIIGTVIGIISLGHSFYVSNKANKIKDKLMSFYVQAEYKKSKYSIILKLEIAYNLFKENDIIDRLMISEILIELNSYKQSLSKDTIKEMKQLHKRIRNFDENYMFFPKKRMKRNSDTIGMMLYSLKVDLNNDFNENEKMLEGIIK